MTSEEPVSAAESPAVLASPDPAAIDSRIHLVVVTSRALAPDESSATSSTLRTRFWHPRDQRWSENDFESLEHVPRLFVDESGWTLLQQQALDGPLTHEWIFQARRVDFAQATPEEILGDLGMTPAGVEQLLEHVSPTHPDG
jgi:hypothetical protein